MIVVLYHASRHIDKNLGFALGKQTFQFGHAGVDFFFVISGFIILFIHRPDVDHPNRVVHYWLRRITRIYPIYWFILAVTIAGTLVSGHMPLPTPFDIIWAATLLPTGTDPIVGVSWTLQYEVLFYIAFSALILNAQAGLSVLALWLAFILLGLFQAQTGFAARLTSPYNLEFFFGMATALWLLHGTVPQARILFILGFTLFIASCGAEVFGLLDGYKPLARLSYGIPSAIMILGLVQLDRTGAIAMPTSLLWLGRSSYSIYLFHLTFIGLAYKLLAALNMLEWAPLWTTFGLITIAGIGGSVAVSIFIEYPLMRLIRKSISDR